MYFGLFSFGGGEIFIVLVAVLVLFGANKIPELARMMGKGMNEFRRATEDIKREFRDGADEFKKDLEDSKKEINHHIHEINETFSEEDNYDPYEDLDDTQQAISTDTKSNAVEEDLNLKDDQKLAQARPHKKDSKKTE